MSGSTAAMTGGTEVSGLPMNRDNVSAPDDEQERRAQARDESAWARGERPDHPPFTRKGPDKTFAERDAAEA